MPDPVDIRDQFHLADDDAYLNTAYMGPLPTSAVAAGTTALAAKSRPWTITVDDFFAPVARLRSSIADLLDGDPDGVAIVGSVSYGIATAAANLPVRPRSTIVLLGDQFPSNVYSWRAVAAANDARVITVGKSAAGWTPALLEVIDERTAVVAVEGCHWTDGSTIDLVRVGEACRAVGAALVVDVTQSLGAVPFAHTEIRPDVVVGALYKWLLGAYGGAFLWVAPPLRDRTPIELSWITRDGSENFTGLVDYTDDYQPGARRYDSGEVSNFANVAASVASLELINRCSPERIARHAGDLTTRLVERVAPLGLEAPDASTRSPHLIGLRLPDDAPDPQAVAAALAAERVYVSVRGTAIRVSVHGFNNQADVDRLVDVLAAVLR
ncbi:aminotransferase class V-fold PLP-dependent enzyme [Microlunatus sp. Gsoil 973]|uniref:aminotransferase class V-fold PLP-dependent enzyme n=1 Tax=Microlunatus sp. Gsoil 973 TaxID=2672569 RepID=UPI0012B47275|nr:aminotransferase class V-fold PLP-dependent enzyme [Microlunatus sp. Gsoil 973]QGN33974.1 aminotransferase class V-fold PLP-dependent enzyme [Microlunatus sp. Gsoil 973]